MDPTYLGSLGWGPVDPTHLGSLGWGPVDPPYLGSLGWGPGDPTHLGILGTRQLHLKSLSTWLSSGVNPTWLSGLRLDGPLTARDTRGEWLYTKSGYVPWGC